MKNKSLLMLSSFIISVAVITSCTAANTGGEGSKNSNTNNIEAESTVNAIQAVTVEYEKDDYYFDWKSGSYETIDLSKGSASIDKSGIYEITGTLKEGSLTVEVDKTKDEGTVFLILNNINISNSASAPIYIKEAKKAVLILENETSNNVYQGSESTADENGEPSAAIFSKANLTITGSGTISVTSDYNDGITSKDDLKITDGTIKINSKADGIVGKDILAIEKADVTIIAGKDGMRSTNDTDENKGNVIIKEGVYTITANNDGIQAYSTLQIDGGIFNITTGGGYTGKVINENTEWSGRIGRELQQTQDTTPNEDSDSMKGLKATGGMIINNGTFTLSNSDDSIHSGGNIIINGGTIAASTDDDGIHSDAGITINGGIIDIKNSYESIEGVDITVNSGKINMNARDDGFNVNDSSGLLTLNGGEIYLNSGGDGLDSNGSVNMTGGAVYVEGPVNSGNGAIDYDRQFTISGGILIASGSSGMAQTPDTSSTQPSIMMYFSTVQQAGTKITLKDDNGKEIISFAPAKQFGTIVISAPDLKTGSNYTLYSNESQIVSFSLSDTVTYVNESGVTTNQSRGPQGGNPQGGGFNTGAPGSERPQRPEGARQPGA
ncbi:hypothetical protein OXPF_24550 [Oxobacter pfennigii]|uniref:Carbohydrate-binding domain-containing protein n=1 Tax=Oxobacter pfennigii TaxID=36849 RepID=A0A0P8W9D3_9CLOT|nr:carbohydrate-binding domain-containing protein [Oxobacter pfennigii]KPU44287.1 hypothetical protein OXPF_24550 [Oxobacter pfennigii]